MEISLLFPEHNPFRDIWPSLHDIDPVPGIISNNNDFGIDPIRDTDWIWAWNPEVLEMPAFWPGNGTASM